MTRSILMMTLLVSSLFLFTSLDPSNPPTGVTGAPGEKTCSTQSGCHSGGVYTGDVTLSGLPSIITPGSNYTLRLTVKSANAKRGGFEITALDGNAVAAGAFATGSGVSIKTSSGRKYARQSTPRTYAGDTISWTFPWTAPAIAVDSVIFYYVGMAANANGNNSGDIAFKNQTIVHFDMVSTTNETQKNKPSLKILPNPATTQILVESSVSDGNFVIYDMIGQIATQGKFTINQSIDVSSLARGSYVFEVSDEKQTVRKRIILE